MGDVNGLGAPHRQWPRHGQRERALFKPIACLWHKFMDRHALLCLTTPALAMTGKKEAWSCGGGYEWAGQGGGVGAEMVGKCRFKGGFFYFLKIDISPKKSA